MSKQINQYTKSRNRADITNSDLLDVDSSDDNGTTYESAKLPIGELTQYIANIFTFYREDGMFPISNNNRTVDFNTGKLKFQGGGDVELRGTGLSNYGFSVQNLTNVERARLGTDDALDTGEIILSNSAGEFFNASDGFISINGATQSLGGESLGVFGGAKIRENLLVGGGNLSSDYGISYFGVSVSTGIGIRAVVGNTLGGTTITKALSLVSTGNANTTQLYGTHLEDFTLGSNNNAISAYGYYSSVRNNNPNSPTNQKHYGAFFDNFTQGGVGNTVSGEMIGVNSLVRVANGNADGKWRAGVFQIDDIGYTGSDALALEVIGDSVINGNINAPNLPTTNTGLVTGDIWNDGGTLKIV